MMPARKRRVAATVTVAVSVLLVSGCARTSDPASSGDALSAAPIPIPVVISPVSRSLPDDPYYLTTQQEQTLELAAQRLTDRCIESYGLHDPFPRLSTSTSVGAARIDYRYLRTDLSDARRYGYQLPPSATGSAGLNMKVSLTQAQDLVIFGPGGYAASKQQQNAQLNGQTPVASASSGSYAGKSVPAGGCLQQARNQLLDSPKHPFAGDDPLVAQLDSEAYNAMLADPRVLAAFAAWSACMRQQGFFYANPAKANDDPRWSDTGAPSSLEVATAVADVQCKAKTNTVGTEYAVESEFQRQLIEQHVQQLADVQNLIQQRLQIAARLLAGGTP